MPSVCIIGVQWGDEGKGKIVDVLSEKADYVVRYQGGANAGHTVVADGQKYVFHHVPSGILNPHTRCVIANGVVLDPGTLLAEIQELRGRGVKFEGKLFISQRAHLVMPYHKVFDALQESADGGMKIGTTLRGIGPCYQDKVARKGLRVCDLYNKRLFRERLKQVVEEKNKMLTLIYKQKPVSFEEIHAQYTKYARQLKPYVTDTIQLINRALDAGEFVVFEGAQGALLSVDFGTYPYVTSSNSDACGISQGSGVPPEKIKRIIGVAKAYTTRVGGGPFPTELEGKLADRIREVGGEYGATTGRPRRVGWLDLVACRYSVMVNGISELAITKLDVLQGLDEIKVAVAYRYGGRTLHAFPPDPYVLEELQPVYRTFKGFREDISKVRRWRDLPEAARTYLKFVENTLKTPITIISVGNGRDQTFFVS